MSTVDFITTLFYEVDEQMRAIPKCNGLQSKPAGPAISAFLGPH